MKLVRHTITRRIFDLDDVDEGMVRCRQSGDMFDPDETEPMDIDEVLGCGKLEKQFMDCEDCAMKYGTMECDEWREETHLSLTIVADMVEIL